MIIKIKDFDEIDELKKLTRRDIFKRFIEKKRLFLYSTKTYKLFKIPLPDQILILFLKDDVKNLYVEKEYKKEIQESLKDIKDYDEALYIIFSKILDIYSKKLVELSKRIADLRKKVLNEIPVSTFEIEKVTEDLEDLEDYLQIIKENSKFFIKNVNYIQILENEINYLLDTISETFSKIQFLMQMQNELYQKRLNERIEKLTLISIIFLPSTLIASIYGMNFQIDVIPSWNHPFGFTIAMVSIILSSVLTYIFLKKKYK